MSAYGWATPYEDLAEKAANQAIKKTGKDSGYEAAYQTMRTFRALVREAHGREAWEKLSESWRAKAKNE